MSSDIVFQANNLLLQADAGVEVQAPALNHVASGGVVRPMLRLSGSEINLNPDGAFETGTLVRGALRMQIPANAPLPDAFDLGPVQQSEPGNSSEVEVELLAEIRRLRTQLWYTQKVLMQVVIPALLKEAP